MPLTKEEKRQRKLAVKIAKDVLKQLDLKKLKASMGAYIEPVKPLVGLAKKDSKAQARALAKTCEVCALGSLFLSAVGMDDDFHFDISTFPDKKEEYLYAPARNPIVSRLSVAFSPQQLDDIEAAFECWTSEYGDNKIRAYNFGVKYKTDKGRLRAICNNIIDNGGVFKP